MNKDLITVELISPERECTIDFGVNVKKGIFHRWTDDGAAVIEFEDGRCGCISAGAITFKEPYKFS